MFTVLLSNAVAAEKENKSKPSSQKSCATLKSDIVKRGTVSTGMGDPAGTVTHAASDTTDIAPRKIKQNSIKRGFSSSSNSQSRDSDRFQGSYSRKDDIRSMHQALLESDADMQTKSEHVGSMSWRHTIQQEDHASSDTAETAPRKLSTRQNSIRHCGSFSSNSRSRYSQRLQRSSSRKNDIQRVHQPLLESDTNLQITSEHVGSLSRRDTINSRHTSDMMQGNLRSTSKIPNADKHRRSMDANETATVSGSTRRALKRSESMALPGRTNHDSQNTGDTGVVNTKNDEIPQPHRRKLVRRNSFANLRRSASSRSTNNSRTKAKGAVLTAFALTKTEQGVELQRKPVENNDESSLTDPSESPESMNKAAFASDAKPKESLKAPVAHGEAHPVFSILSGELWSDDKVIVNGALKELGKLCQEDDQNKSIFPLAGYCPLCGVIRKWYHDTEILITGFRLLQLTSENFAIGAFGCGLLASIVCAMENFETDGPLQAAACGALATMMSTSKSGPSIKLAVDLNGPSVLVKAMESFPNSIEVQQKAIIAFLSMARFPQLREYLGVGSAVVRESMEKLNMSLLVPENLRSVKDNNGVLGKNMVASRGA
jgi:hypothetical protein